MSQGIQQDGLSCRRAYLMRGLHAIGDLIARYVALATLATSPIGYTLFTLAFVVNIADLWFPRPMLIV